MPGLPGNAGASADPPVTVDFLIEPDDALARAGKIFDLETDFAAIIAPGVHLAFEDRISVELSGATILGESAARKAWVCGPGAFVVLQSLAFHIRGENKDAYDLLCDAQLWGVRHRRGRASPSVPSRRNCAKGNRIPQERVS